MRSTKELLELLLDQYENNRLDGIQWTGLCLAISRLRVSHVIDQYEKEALFKAIGANKPDVPWSEVYWWPKGRVKPRVEFIKQLINSYEQ